MKGDKLPMKLRYLYLFVFLLFAISMWSQTHTEVTVEDDQTITGNKIFSSLASLGTTACEINGIEYVGVGAPFSTCWGGADIGAQINAAYTAMPSNGGMIVVSNLGLGCVGYTTPINFSTAGKPVILWGQGDSTCLNFTPSSGTAITLGWGGAAPHLFYGGGIRDLTIIGACATTACSGVTSVGLVVQAEGAFIQNLQLGTSGAGFLNGVNIVLNGFITTCENCRIYYNNVGVGQGTSANNEGFRFVQGSISANGTAAALNGGGDLYFDNVSFDDNTASPVISIGGTQGIVATFHNDHWENPTLTTPSYYIQVNNANAMLVIRDGTMLEDNTTGTPTQFVTATAADIVYIDGTEVYTAGATITQVVNISALNALHIKVINPFPARVLADYLGAYTGPLFDEVMIPGTVGSSFFNINGIIRLNPPQNTGSALSFVESNTAPSGASTEDRFWADSADHLTKYNPNNAGEQHISKIVMVTGSAYTNATTGFTSITALSFTVGASKSYTMDCQITWQGSASTTGPKFQITGPASPTSVTVNATSAITATTGFNGSVVAFSTGIANTGTITATTNFPAVVTMGLVNGVNAGTIQLQAAANGTGTLTIQPGSYCQIQ